MITADNLSLFKNHKKIFANLGFSLSVSSTLIITGENGSGKTSLLKIIAGITESSSGQILWDGQDVKNIRGEFASDIQLVGHKNFLKANLTVYENLNFYCKLFNSENALNAALKFFDLEDLKHQMVKNLSAGIQKKIMLSRLLACPTTIWILDEPSINLDEKSKKKLHGLIKNHSQENGMIIMATHDQMFFDLGPKINMADFN